MTHVLIICCRVNFLGKKLDDLPDWKLLPPSCYGIEMVSWGLLSLHSSFIWPHSLEEMNDQEWFRVSDPTPSCHTISFCRISIEFKTFQFILKMIFSCDTIMQNNVSLIHNMSVQNIQNIFLYILEIHHKSTFTSIILKNNWISI